MKYAEIQWFWHTCSPNHLRHNKGNDTSRLGTIENTMFSAGLFVSVQWQIRAKCPHNKITQSRLHLSYSFIWTNATIVSSRKALTPVLNSELRDFALIFTASKKSVCSLQRLWCHHDDEIIGSGNNLTSKCTRASKLNNAVLLTPLQRTKTGGRGGTLK